MRRIISEGTDRLQRLVGLSLTLILAVSSLSACGKAADTGVSANPQDQTNVAESASDAAALAETEYIMPDMAVSSNVWEVAGVSYVIGAYSIISYDEASGDIKTLWTKDYEYDEHGNIHMFAGNNGLILRDRLLFTDSEDVRDRDDSTSTLKVMSMKLDGSDLKEIWSEEGLTAVYYHDMAYVDGILYVYYLTDMPPLCLALDDDCDVSRNIDYTTLDAYRYYDPEQKAESQKNNGSELVFPAVTYKECGKLISDKNYGTLVVTDADTGASDEYSGQSVVSIYRNNALLYHYNTTTARCEYSLLDISTGEFNKLWNSEDYAVVFAMDDAYAYVYGENTATPDDAFEYYRIDLNTGERSLLYRAESDGSALPNQYPNEIAAAYKDGRLYCGLNRDYALSLVRVDTATGDVTVLSDSFYDPGIGRLGKLKGDSVETRYNDIIMTSASATVLQLDDRYAAASAINSVMDGHMADVLALAKDNEEECINWYEESGGEYFIPYSFDSSFSHVSYNDGNIIDIIQSGYDYYGGAHGMPYIISYVFDLNTGERLFIGDLIGISEDELKELVVEYTTKHMADIGDTYWSDYEETVREYIGYEYDSFYLTEDGIVFYFSPYVLASYASGFQEIEVPYSELKPTFR